jgi:hypothetical protein
MNHTAFFGDATYTFALTDTMIHELQNKTGVGIGALYLRVVNSQFHVADLTEVIRLGLIGGGTAPATAQRLIDAYAVNRPFDETFPLALDILDARWTGKPEVPAIPQDDLLAAVTPIVEPWQADIVDRLYGRAAATGDMSAAINDALQQVAE